MIDFSDLSKSTVSVLKSIFEQVLTNSSPQVVVEVFKKISSSDKLNLLRDGLKLFLKHFLLRKSASLHERVQLAVKTL